jgi:uncharacterized protein YjdB/GH25 family lysozyme M1 (1,4-beta-N-acetylmuramidase)
MQKRKMFTVLLVSVITVLSIIGYFTFVHLKVNAADSMPSAGTANLNVVDISQFNDDITKNTDDINFATLKTQVDAVYIRAFSHANNTLSVDAQAVNFANSAQNVNLKYGFYYYYVPTLDPADATSQADIFYNFVRQFAYSCVPVLDFEDNTAALTQPQLAASVKAFADEFKRLSGFDLMIYSYPYFMKNNLDPAFSWNAYKLWIAHYDVTAPMTGISSTWMPENLWCWPRWDMWQYTSQGTLSSIPDSAGGHLDMSYATDNIFLSTPTALTTLESPSQTGIDGGDITVSGWALSHAGINRVDVYLDDYQKIGTITDMSLRPDVQQTMNSNGRYNDGLHSGFSYTFDASMFTSGKHILRLAVINRDGTTTWTGYTFTYGKVAYQSHVQDVGWQDWVSDGATSGTTGQSKRLEAMNIKLAGINGGIEYRSQVQDIGWMDWVADGALTGTSGQAKRMEAIQIRLTGAAANLYDVYYRVQAQNFGWMDWASDGASAGTAGYSYRLEAIQIVLVSKGAAAPGSTTTPYMDYNTQPVVSYQTHVQDIGWQGFVSNGATSGTSGKSKRLEAINIKLDHLTGGIEYQTHVQDIGWMDWVADGALSGTSGQSKRLEAIAIRLTGQVADQYDVYYRVHAQNFGWLDWAMDGQSAGTAGYSYRLEAIQIVLVPKGGAAPGPTTLPFVQK